MDAPISPVSPVLPVPPVSRVAPDDRRGREWLLGVVMLLLGWLPPAVVLGGGFVLCLLWGRRP